MILLIVSFLLIATLLCLVLIQSKVNPFFKAVLIVVSIWYTVAILFIPQHFRGWPIEKDSLPDRSWILFYRIVEPKSNDKGGMYFWLIDHIEQVPFKINPRETFAEVHRLIPRAYGIPYDRELHKRLERVWQKKKTFRGGFVVWKQDERLKTKSEGRGKEGRGKFEIINPVELLPQKQIINSGR